MPRRDWRRINAIKPNTNTGPSAVKGYRYMRNHWRLGLALTQRGCSTIGIGYHHIVDSHW